MTPHAKTNNKMADEIPTQAPEGRIPTQKPFWLNDDETKVDVVYKPLDLSKKFNVAAFVNNFHDTEKFREADKTELSQILFKDDRLRGVSDMEVGTFRKKFSRDVVQERMDGYVASNAGNLINLVSAVDSVQGERHILGKNRNATTSTFRADVPEKATSKQRAAVEKYNGACDAVDAYHTEMAKMEDGGETAYVNEKLDNVTEMQMAVILAATGSMPGDPSRIARAYKNFHTATALEVVAAVGIANYTETNHITAKNLANGHRKATEGIEAKTKIKLQELGMGATRDQTAEIYRAEADDKDSIAGKFQHAETDAGYIFKDLAGKANEAGTEYLAATPALAPKD